MIPKVSDPIEFEPEPGQNEPGVMRDCSRRSVWHQPIIFRVLEDRRLYTILAAALIVITLVMRVPPMNRSFWADELCAVNQSRGSVADAITYQVENGNHPPLYYLILNTFQRFGRSEAWLRLPGFLAGAVTVVAIGGIGYFLGDRFTGWVSAFLAATSHSLCWPSYEARNHVFCLCFGTLAWLCLVLALRTDRWKWWLLLSFCIAACCYSFYYGFFVAVFLAVYLIASKPRVVGRKAIVSALLAALLFAPWLPAFRKQVSRTIGRFQLREVPPAKASPMQQARQSARAFTLHGAWNQFGYRTKALFGIPYTPLLSLVLATALGLFFTRTKPFRYSPVNQYRAALAVLIALIAFSLVIQFASSGKLYSWLHYSVYVAVGGAVLMALLLNAISPKWRTAFAAAIIVCSVGAELPRSMGYHLTRDDWRGAVKIIDDNRTPSQAVLTNAPAIVGPYEFYSKYGEVDRVYHDINQEAVDEIVSAEVQIWLLWIPPHQVQSDQGLQLISTKLIDSGFEQNKSVKIGQITVRSFFRKEGCLVPTSEELMP